MSITSIGTTSSSTWTAKTKTGDNGAAFEQVAATLAPPPAIPAAYDKSWMTKNLTDQDKATITATTGIKFGANGSILTPLHAGPNDSYALQKTVHLLNSQRGGFPKDLTPEEILRLVKQNAPGADPEPLQDFIKRTYSNGNIYG